MGENWNDDPEPFVWHMSAEGIIRGCDADVLHSP